MPNDISLEGMEELINRLEYMASPERQKAVIKSALNSGAKIIKEKVKPKIPVDPNSHEHAADHIEISSVKNKNGVPYVTVGPDKGNDGKYFYLKFLEWGTKFIPAKAMFGRTLAEEKDAVKSAIIKEIKEGLRL